MVNNLWRRFLSSDLVRSRLFDEKTFYRQFIHDLGSVKREVVIESPYITSQRMFTLLPVFNRLITKKVKIYVVTRDPEEHDSAMRQQAESEIRNFEMMGIQVLITADYDHRKLAILDRKVLWEGSPNILSQSYSREIMRRIASETQARKMFRYINLGKYIY